VSVTILEDLLARGMKPEPPSDAELQAVAALRLGDYEILSEKLVLIAQEGKEVMTRMGISSMLHSGDTLVGVYTAAGDLVAPVCGTYLHSVTGQIPIKFILAQYSDDPSIGVREGDIFYCNEALYGGIHNPDQFALMPVFNDGELVAWAVCGAHQSETGGSEPGGEVTQAHTRHDEGMKLSPIKIGENYTLRGDILRMMENFISRAPRMQVTDVKARVSACDRVRVRLQELARARGNQVLRGLFRRMIQQTSAGVRRRIASWPDGTYRHVVFMDTTGHDAYLLRASVAITVAGDQLTIDFAGTSPEHEGSYNAFAHIIAAHSAVNLYQFPFHDFPISSGMLENIDIRVPKGSFFDADSEAAVSCSPLVGALAFPLLGVALSKIMYSTAQRDLVCGFCTSSASAVMVSGVNQHGYKVTDFMGYPLNAYGLAARHDMDGVDVFGFPHGPWGKAPDVEDIEQEFPLLHLYEHQLTDSGGFGRYRGGCGAAVCYMVYGSRYLAFTSSQKESKFPSANGLFGGYAATTLPGIRVMGSDLLARMRAGEPDIPADDYALAAADPGPGEVILEHQTRGVAVLREGDILAASTNGGGGYGDVLEREPEAVLADVLRSTISADVARDVYRVVFDPETLLLDEEATRQARAAERQARARRGRPYAEFIERWSARRPPEEILAYYGEWPSAAPNREVVRI
jgi:N-methylhydantoinase B/oxoprolinase/acetone carboxylase alpha subunit